MDEGSEGNIVDWLIDASAAAALGAAVAFATWAIIPPQAAAIAGIAALLLALGVLRLVPAEGRRFDLPDFAMPASGEMFEPVDVLELTELEPLMLNDALPPPAADSRVVRLFEISPLPTAGELKRRIDAHLGARDGGADVVPLAADASAALKQALAELKRSLG